jgi:pyochelin synthetase
LSASELLRELESLGVRVWQDEGNIHYRAPKGTMTSERLERLRAAKPELLDELQVRDDQVHAHGDPAHRFDPFPLTDVQSAYLLGRSAVFPYGRVACHGYGELVFPELDASRLELAWQDVIERHDMLRAVVLAEGGQRVLPAVPPYRVDVRDVRGSDALRFAAAVEATRADLEQRMHEPTEWPLFELRATLGDAESIVHLSIDFLIADYVSIQLLLDELLARYEDPTHALPPFEIGFRDYLLAERALRSGPAYERDRAYWLRRIDELPPAPELPTAPDSRDAGPHFRRRRLELDNDAWAAFKSFAQAAELTASTAVLACYAEVVARWSRRQSFTLDVTVLSRLPLHRDVDQLIGDFTSIELLAVEHDANVPFRARARSVQAQLWEDLDHRRFSGVEVMRELARRRGRDEALFPVVFTSALGLGGPVDAAHALRPELGYGVSQTPQVWIDCQVGERDGRLALNWDVREAVFPEGHVDDMFESFKRLLERLAADGGAWEATDVLELPARQLEFRRRVNATDAPLPDHLLQEPILERAVENPERPAVVTPTASITYGELVARAQGVADWLDANACRASDRVGVLMQKGWEQPVAVLGTLLAGGAYVPVDANQPPARRNAMLADVGVRLVLTQSVLASDLPPAYRSIGVDELEAAPVVAPASPRAQPDDVAYVVYTSGSSGPPKGVMVSHRSAANTIVDVNRRFSVTRDDTVVALAHLGFDLSVYDLFGVLGVGGTVVVPDASRRGDPSHWAELIAAHEVTLWNSVPAQMQMLDEYLATASGVELPSLRLALLSGDWIPVDLPGRIRSRLPQLELVALGGATEAAIWSIFHEIREVPPAWPSIPYGRPLANQTFHVLDAAGRPCPDLVAGELHIGGAGVAIGYTDETLTRQRFFVHEQLRERLYRTGDQGRYLPTGEIEFLGREDLQVKIRGHRIELGEVETALRACDGVGAAAALVAGDAPFERRVVAFVEPARRPPRDTSALAVDLGVAGTEAANGVFASVDAAAYLAYAAALDDAALATMAATLRALADGETLRVDDLIARGVVDARHRRLLRRWSHALGDAGLLSPAGDGSVRMRASLDASAAWGLAERLSPPDDAPLLAYFRRAADALPDVLRGEDALTLLFPAGDVGSADALYRDARLNRAANAAVAAAVKRIADEDPGRPLRVLEVGAGTGGTTAAVLDSLRSREFDYLFTDVSPFFLNVGRERFAEREGVRFAVLDLDADHGRQRFAENSFDVVVAGDVLHAARDVDGALARLRALLAPAGALVFSEMTRDHAQILTSLEPMVRLGDGHDFDDFRRGRDLTFVPAEEWVAALLRAGAGLAVCVTEGVPVLSELGLHVFVAGFKGDRERIDRAAVDRDLRNLLPEYMLPSKLSVLDALPLTANGKTDRRALAATVREKSIGAPAGGDEPATDLERRLAAVWADVVGAPPAGRAADFFASGGDSLLAAQLAGRLRDALPEAADVFFDDLLRGILEFPTVAELARFLERRPAKAHTPADVPATLIPLGGSGDSPVRVLVHDEGGALEAVGALVAALAAQGPVIGFVVASPERYRKLAPESLIDTIAAEYADALLAAGYSRVHLIGFGFGGIVATEMARYLVEGGNEAVTVTILAGPPADRERDVDVVAASAAAERAHVLAPYAGDLTVAVPAGETAVLAHALAFWRGVCLGDVTALELPGDRATWLDYQHAPSVAARLGAADPAEPAHASVYEGVGR